MTNAKKNHENILSKLGIEKLNEMQLEAQKAIENNQNIVLLSPTGTGKTLAFLLPLIKSLKYDITGIQILILVPSRELAIQIEQVIREMGTGYKTNAVYGGRAGSQDRIDLKQAPAILIGTPGRVADHIRNETISTETIHTLVLDEFDKSLEVGFENEMIHIVDALDNLDKKVLTSATQKVKIPKFVGIENPKHLNFLKEKITQLAIKKIISPSADKLETLVAALKHLGDKPGIIFCNFKDSIQEVSEFLEQNNIQHGCFHGGMEQRDRETSLIKFRNGTYQLLIATDLAARGIDIPELKYILHYELPQRPDEFIHRNGRTARMNADGTAYVLIHNREEVPGFIKNYEIEELKDAPELKPSKWTTIHISGGRRDKISKGDIAGLFFKQGELNKEELGIIEIKQDCAYVALHSDLAKHVIEKVNNKRLKKKKVRVSIQY